MAKLLKLRRGTTTQHSSFTGAEGEVTVDTDKDTLVVHDGSTAGGHPIAAEDLSNVSSTTIAGRLANDSIAPSKIGAGTLPSDVTVASANLVDGTIVNADIAANAAIEGTKLENSGVTAGSYGSSSAIPIVTVDAQGLVTSASTTAIDSTTIANGTSNVAVANNGDITTTRSGTARFVVNDAGAAVTGNLDVSSGVDVTGNITVSGTVDGVDVAALNTAHGSISTTNGAILDGTTAATQAAGNNTTRIATTAFVTTAIANADAFPSGTKMLFQQTSAPTGWTKITSNVENKALRVTSGTAGSGGSNAFTNTLADRSLTANAGNTTQGGNVNVSVANTTAGGNVSVANTTAGGNVSISSTSTSGSVNSHTLSSNQMPSHSHNIGNGNQDNRGTTQMTQSRTNFNNPHFSTHNTGGSGSHSHGFSGSSHSHNGSLSGTAHNHNASFSGSAHSHNANASFSGSAHNHSISVNNLDMAVQYLDVIIASKD